MFHRRRRTTRDAAHPPLDQCTATTVDMASNPLFQHGASAGTDPVAGAQSDRAEEPAAVYDVVQREPVYDRDSSTQCDNKSVLMHESSGISAPLDPYSIYDGGSVRSTGGALTQDAALCGQVDKEHVRHAFSAAGRGTQSAGEHVTAATNAATAAGFTYFLGKEIHQRTRGDPNP